MAYDTVFAPKGFVRIRDEDGNVLFEGHNMVVKSGRNELFKAFIGENNLGLTNLRAYIGDTSKYNSNFVTADDKWTADDESENSLSEHCDIIPSTETHTQITSTAIVSGTLYTKKYTNESSLATWESKGWSAANFTDYYSKDGEKYNSILKNRGLCYYIDSENMVLHFGLRYKPENGNPKTISTFGLVFSYKVNKVDKHTLFSRIVIPERIIKNTTPLIFDYYLYF